MLSWRRARDPVKTRRRRRRRRRREERGNGDDEEEEEGEDIDDAETESAVVVEDSSDDHEKHVEDVKDEDDDNSSLAERCDKFMIPWIGCIQEHRNAYTLISNAFYRDDMIDPLESTIRDDKRVPFPITTTGKEFDVDEINDIVQGYVVAKFQGVEIDLGNWKEHVDADYDDDADGNGKDVDAYVAPPTSGTAEPHLINAFARFRLVDPNNGRRPIEVAYIKDQNGTLLGFDSFTKAKEREGEGGESHHRDDVAASGHHETGTLSSKDGECTFHIIPGETTSIVAYAIYRGAARDEDGNGSEGGDREDVLYYTPEIPLPNGGVANLNKLK
ncbi:hypothetical protein ACHAXA_007367 [Cyclostephanos tholiformis]|uniref:Uncharacterized protein n=1 Tax=Cyclostephanos tholiformis TaxID=382380 RepID=A0ABD3RW68_9STRA